MEAVSQVRAAWQQGVRSVCLVAPTGSGKTYMARQLAAPFGRDVLCIVHTHELKSQSAAWFDTVTIQQLLLSGTGGRKPRLLIWDECHHSAGDEWRSANDLFPEATVLGLTATPQRQDGRPLHCFDTMVSPVTVQGMRYSELIKAGHIVPCDIILPDRYFDKKDPDPAKAYLLNAPGTQAIFICGSIAEAEKAASDIGPTAAPFHSLLKDSVRSRRMRAFRDPKDSLKILTTYNALTEGFDAPATQTLVLSRPCHFVGSYLQAAGRVLRSSPGKRAATLIDCRGASVKHGSPTQDRIYSIDGGIEAEEGTSVMQPAFKPRSERDKYECTKWHVLPDEKFQNLTREARKVEWARLLKLAERKGLTRQHAEKVYTLQFGEAP
jgi:DNA repair protein RadD